MKIGDYGTVGFDMDNTIIRYRLRELLSMEYHVLANYVVKVKGYNYLTLLQPLGDRDQDFMQKGLVLDIEKGNFLKLSPDGVILLASHGTRKMSEDEIAGIYGKSQRNALTEAFCHSLIESCTGGGSSQLLKPVLVKNLRTFKDYFDMPAALLCAKIVDCIDSDTQTALSGPPSKYKFWRDVLCGLVDMFQREHFHSDEGGFYPELKQQPDKYLWPCSSAMKQWLKELRDNQITFVISGSEAEYVNHVARYCLGNDWQHFFHFIVCNARKPSFFDANNSRPFRLYNGEESNADNMSEVPNDALLQNNTVYVHGNWNQLNKTLLHYYHERKGTKLGQDKLGSDRDASFRCVYVGDNLVQDVLAPRQMTHCDTIAVVEELSAEGWADMNETTERHPDRAYVESKFWGSFFYVESAFSSDSTVTGPSRMNTLWGDVLRTSSRLCVPCATSLVYNPLSHEYQTFGDKSEGGFYPADPIILHE